MPALVLALFISSTPTAQAQAQDEELVTQEAALAAMKSFLADPANGLEYATIFLKYVESHGDVHLVIDQRLIPWMYEDNPANMRAVLYSAYVAGNMQSQLLGASDGDDPKAALSAALNAYESLRANDGNPEIDFFESLREARNNDNFAAAVEALLNGK